MNPFADPFVVFILVLSVVVAGVVYAVDTYGRAPPKEEDRAKHNNR